jgi:hypothetical protein
MEIIPDCFCRFRLDDIVDTIPKGINISVNNIAADSNDVSAWVTIVNREIRLEITDIFGSPTIVNQLYELLLHRRGRGIRRESGVDAGVDHLGQHLAELIKLHLTKTNDRRVSTAAGGINVTHMERTSNVEIGEGVCEVVYVVF